jgi:hypothetical protein
VEGLCERGDEPPGSIKCWEVLEQLHSWQLLKKGSAPWVSEVAAYGMESFSEADTLPGCYCAGVTRASSRFHRTNPRGI